MDETPSVDRSSDGRWILVQGRRWRASDPAIPDALRTELVAELMSARRAVKDALRASDAVSESSARARLQQAKVALGERGEPWWETPSPEGRRDRLAAAVLTLARHRSPEKTICPSDAARAVGGAGWRTLMEPTREVVRRLASDGVVEVTSRGAVLQPDAAWRGPVRIRLAPARP